MTKLEQLREQIEENKKWAFADSAFGSQQHRDMQFGSVNAYELVLDMIDKLSKPICQKCGGTIQANHGRPQCINCGAYHDSDGNLIPHPTPGEGSYKKPKIKNDTFDSCICPECGEYCPDDKRVQSGMKCIACAYGL